MVSNNALLLNHRLFFGAGTERCFLFFCLGVLKSISANDKDGTVLNAGGSQTQGRDVQENYCFTRVLASAVRKTCEQTSQESTPCHTGIVCCHLIYNTSILLKAEL